MAYSEQTSIATTAELVNHIVGFASANGWTTERNELSGANRRATLRKPGTSDYLHVYNDSAIGVGLRISVGYDAGAAPSAQPNVSGEAFTNLGAGPYPKAFLFSSGEMVWVTVSIAASGEYRHLTFGVLDKIGAYNGGSYVESTDWGRGNWWAQFNSNRAPFFVNVGSVGSYGRVRADADGRSNFFFNIGQASGPPSPIDAITEVGVDTATPGGAMLERSDNNAFSGRSIFHTIPVFVSRTGSQRYYSPIGVVHDVRFCSLQKFEPEQEVTIGADTYKVFPVVAKRVMNGTVGVQPAASGFYGYAVRKVS